MATPKQVSYLFALVVQHPDFKKMMNWDTWEAEESDVVAWLNSKYADEYLEEPISRLEQIDQETTSALIRHLQLRPTMKEYLSQIGESE